MNCSIVAAAMPTERSRGHETITQEPFLEVQGQDPTSAGWLAAIGAATVNTENFGSSPLGDLAAGTPDIGLFNITINAADSFTEIADSGAVNGTREFQGRLCEDPFCALTAMSFGFDSPLIGFAGDWASTTSDHRLTMLWGNGATIKFSDYLTTGVGTGFLGVVDSAGFSQITFGLEDPDRLNGAEVFQLDNARLAAGTANIPEPATLALLGLGLAGLGAMRRRKA